MFAAHKDGFILEELSPVGRNDQRPCRGTENVASVPVYDPPAYKTMTQHDIGSQRWCDLLLAMTADRRA